MMRKRIYLGGPIAGLTWDEAVSWRDYAAEELDPLWGLSPLRIEGGLVPFGEGPGTMPFVERFNRDYSDIQTCEGIIFNMLNAKQKSIGTTCEIAWSYSLLKPTALVMGEVNINYDKFLMQCITGNPKAIVVSTLDLAINFMRSTFLV
jgi:hypothetical protein